MICKVCGTEIADKALICYRCGTSTFEPAKREGRPRRRRANLLPSVAALVVLVVAALLMARAAVGAVPQIISLVLVIVAALVFLWQVWNRRSRR